MSFSVFRIFDFFQTFYHSLNYFAFNLYPPALKAILYTKKVLSFELTTNLLVFLIEFCYNKKWNINQDTDNHNFEERKNKK